MILAEQIRDYITSGEFDKDLKNRAGGSFWVDISEKFGLCKGCISVDDNRMEFFNTLIHIPEPTFYESLSRAESKHMSEIAKMKLTMGSAGYKKVKEMGVGYLKYDPNCGGDCDNAGGKDQFRVMYNRFVIDYLLGMGLLSRSTKERIEELSKVDRDLYTIGEIFVKHLDSGLYAMYFTLYRNKKTGDYCIKFKKDSGVKLDDISGRLSLLFNTTGRLYVKNKEELEITLELVR